MVKYLKFLRLPKFMPPLPRRSYMPVTLVYEFFFCADVWLGYSERDRLANFLLRTAHVLTNQTTNQPTNKQTNEVSKVSSTTHFETHIEWLCCSSNGEIQLDCLLQLCMYTAPSHTFVIALNSSTAVIFHFSSCSIFFLCSGLDIYTCCIRIIFLT
jgi:hypothetical protein